MEIKPVGRNKELLYPTREQFSAHPELLSDFVPFVWKQKKIVAAAVAALAFSSVRHAARADDNSFVASQTKTVPEQSTENQLSKKQTPIGWIAPLFLHGTGRGAIGCVVVSPPTFLSETEAMKVIIDEFGKHGITFDQKDMRVPDVSIPERYTDYDFESQPMHEELVLSEKKNPFIIDAFSTKYNFGFEFVGFREYINNGGPDSMSSVQDYDFIETGEFLREQLMKIGTINTAIFFDPAEPIGYEETNLPRDEMIEHIIKYFTSMENFDERDLERQERKLSKSSDEELKKLVSYVCSDRWTDIECTTVESPTHSQLRSQVNDFVAWMKEQGIIEDESQETLQDW